jgi:hypothetical protein
MDKAAWHARFALRTYQQQLRPAPAAKLPCVRIIGLALWAFHLFSALRIGQIGSGRLIEAISGRIFSYIASAINFIL